MLQPDALGPLPGGQLGVQLQEPDEEHDLELDRQGEGVPLVGGGEGRRGEGLPGEGVGPGEDEVGLDAVPDEGGHGHAAVLDLLRAGGGEGGGGARRQG